MAACGLTLAACQNATPQQRGTAVGAAVGTGIGLVAGHHGVPWPLPAELSDDAGLLVRGICTMYPDGNLFSIINRVIETTFVVATSPHRAGERFRRRGTQRTKGVVRRIAVDNRPPRT